MLIPKKVMLTFKGCIMNLETKLVEKMRGALLNFYSSPFNVFVLWLSGYECSYLLNLCFSFYLYLWFLWKCILLSQKLAEIKWLRFPILDLMISFKRDVSNSKIVKQIISWVFEMELLIYFLKESRRVYFVKGIDLKEINCIFLHKNSWYKNLLWMKNVFKNNNNNVFVQILVYILETKQ